RDGRDRGEGTASGDGCVAGLEVEGGDIAAGRGQVIDAVGGKQRDFEHAADQRTGGLQEADVEAEVAAKRGEQPQFVPEVRGRDGAPGRNRAAGAAQGEGVAAEVAGEVRQRGGGECRVSL